jgi:hypothetical protein
MTARLSPLGRLRHFRHFHVVTLASRGLNKAVSKTTRLHDIVSVLAEGTRQVIRRQSSRRNREATRPWHWSASGWLGTAARRMTLQCYRRSRRTGGGSCGQLAMAGRHQTATLWSTTTTLQAGSLEQSCMQCRPREQWSPSPESFVVLEYIRDYASMVHQSAKSILNSRYAHASGGL